jgi:hypothetical protein
MKTLLRFCGIAAILMGLIGIIIQHPGLIYFGLMGLGLISIGVGFLVPEEM